MNKSIFLLPLIFILLLASCKLPAETPFVAGTGITGAWYNPDRDGEGFLVEILDGEGIDGYPEALKSDWQGKKERLPAISDKPYAIAESGYFSEQQSFDFGNGVTITLDGSEEKQQQWIARLLAEAERRNYRFVVNFVNRDYDPLCRQVLCDDLVRVWEASGLVRESGEAKAALTNWRNYLARPLKN